MKGIGGNPALDAYQRMSVSGVSAAKTVQRPEAAKPERAPEEKQMATKVSISSQARQLAGAAEAQINTQKVDALRSQLSTGTLKMDNTLIANRMLDALG